MSDTVDETPEEFSSPGPNFSGEQLTIRVGARNYLFGRTEHGTLIYMDNFHPDFIPDEDDDKPFDPSEYR